MWFIEEFLKYNIDWFKEVFKLGLYINVNIIYIGSSGCMCFFVMVDYYCEEGVIKDFILDCFIFCFNNDVKFIDCFIMLIKILGLFLCIDS